MKTCKTCTHITTQKVWHLFPVAYCGHPASAHPVTGAPTLPCATAREGHSCEGCKPGHCGIDARLWRAPEPAPRPKWESVPVAKSADGSVTMDKRVRTPNEESPYRYTRFDAQRIIEEAHSALSTGSINAAAPMPTKFVWPSPGSIDWLHDLSDAVHGVKR